MFDSFVSGHGASRNWDRLVVPQGDDRIHRLDLEEQPISRVRWEPEGSIRRFADSRR